MGLLVTWEGSGRPPAPGDAVAVGAIFGTPFIGPCAAHGKVVFLDVRAGHVIVFQVEGERVEQVFCGNANVAAGAMAFLVQGQVAVALGATDGIAAVGLEMEVQPAGDCWHVESAWRVTPRADDFSTGWDQEQRPVARVDALNQYEFSVGPKLEVPVKFDSCRRKGCRITPGPVPRLQVSTCGRFHGALPQTGAISLQMARSAFPFIGEAVRGDTVEHPGGLERLPECRRNGRDYLAVMPATMVEFAEPSLKG